MPVIFANPAGFWALLGVPVILLIHFLQRESRRLPVSTLFLLEHIDRESVQGRRFERLRHSIPLWLQLLAVLILAWILAEPRWTASRSATRVVLVVDSSASMSAFREDLMRQLSTEIPPLTANLGTTEYTLIESHHRGAQLYRGTSIDEMVDALEGWNPVASAHSPEVALQTGRSLAGSEGTLVYVTDHPPETLPFAASLLSIGRKIDNVGFVGFRIEKEKDDTSWEVSLRNYSPQPQIRQWFLAAGTQRTDARELNLQPGETRSLRGTFPDAATRVSLLLKEDDFPRDDRLNLVIPEPKPLLVAQAGDASTDSLVRTIVESLENAPLAQEGETPDLVFSTYNPLEPEDQPAVSIVFLHQQSVPRQFLAGTVVTSNHSLVAGLDWQGLIGRSTPSIPATAGETTLVWQGDRPLILLREQAGVRQLIFNFDVVHSNATRLPAFVVLIHRFIDRIRVDKVALQVANTELGESLGIAYRSDSSASELTVETENGSLVVSPSRARTLRAPDLPGFFSVRQGTEPLFRGAANFADTREADFSQASSVSTLHTLPQAIAERHTVSDPWWQLWLILVLVAILLSWKFVRRKERTSFEEESAPPLAPRA